MKRLKTIIVLLVVINGFVCGQGVNKFKIGYGFAQASGGIDFIHGQFFYFGIDRNNYKRLFFTIGLIGNYNVKKREYEQGYSYIEKTNSIGLEIDYNLNIKIRKLRFNPFIGASVAYSDEQFVTQLHIGKNRNGIYLFDYNMAKQRWTKFGYNYGVNFDIKLNDNMILGIWISNFSYPYYHGINYIGLTLKKLDWNFSLIIFMISKFINFNQT